MSQTFVSSIRPDLSTDTVVREFPDRAFKASVFSTAEALDPASRTLLTEIRMPNEGGVLRPSMYADVKFHVARTNPPFLLPSTAIIIRRRTTCRTDGAGERAGVLGTGSTLGRGPRVGRRCGMPRGDRPLALPARPLCSA